MWTDTLSLQGELKTPLLLERTPPKTQSVNLSLPLARRDSRSPWERLQLTGIILSSSQMWKLKWFQGSVTRWSERGQHCVTLFRWHFLRKQDKEWEEAKEEKMEEKLSPLEKNRIHFVEYQVKMTITQVFELLWLVMSGSMTFSPEKQQATHKHWRSSRWKRHFLRLRSQVWWICTLPSFTPAERGFREWVSRWFGWVPLGHFFRT